MPPNPYLRFDTNDYSLHPSVVGRRVEVRATQREITAVVPDTGELACGHQRSFAEHRTITALEHARVLRQRRGQRDDVVVDRRPLQRHDQLIAYAGPPSSRTCSARKAPAAARALPKLAERARDAD